MMSGWLRIEGGVAVEFTDEDPAGRFHPSLLWVPAISGEQIGWAYNGTALARPDPPAPIDLAPIARDQRDVLLAKSDWTQLPDAPLSDEARAAWSAYRQELRGVPEQTGFPDVVTWPAAPSP